MTTKITISAALAGVVLAGAAQAAPMNATAYALGDNGNTLVTIGDLNAPGAATGNQLTLGGSPIAISALTFRPETRQFYGYSNQQDAVYLVDVATGDLTFQSSNPNPTETETVGIDFNNAADAARFVTDSDRNFVFFPENFATLEDGTPDPRGGTIIEVDNLAYLAGDDNFGDDPSVIGNAYTNAVPFPDATQQFALDAQQNTLVTLANNDGFLETVGTFDVDFGDDGGFDILSFSEGDNIGYALMTTNTGQGLYSFNLPLNDDGTLADGAIGGTDNVIATTFLGQTSTSFGVLDGFAVAPAPVPVPAAFGMLGLALAGLGGLRRLRRA